MRCACCLRLINPANAFTVREVKRSFDGSGSWTEVRHYGPVCAVRLGITTPAPKLKRKPGRFAISKKSQAVQVDEFQDQLFGVMA